MREQSFSQRSRHPLSHGATVMALVCVAVSGMAGLPSRALAQAITFEAELPRVLVLIEEDGELSAAARDFASYLRQADFPLVDPSLAQRAVQAERFQYALGGDDAAALELGRDFGAQVLILGRINGTVTRDDDDSSRILASSDLEVRALRLDRSRVVATGRSQGRQFDETERAARTAAAREAATKVLMGTAFLGRIANDWSAEPWSAAAYFSPDPGSVASAALAAALSTEAGAPHVAIVNTWIAPGEGTSPAGADGGESASDESATRTVHVWVEGVALGSVDGIEIEGVGAELEPLDAAAAAELGLPRAGHRFFADVVVPEDSPPLRLVARASGGRSTETLVAPRIGQRWAVVVGVGSYASSALPELPSAAADARALAEFLSSEDGADFPAENVLLLTDAGASARGLRDALFEFLAQAEPDDLVLIYFAGHGVPDPARPENLYLLPADADLGALSATAIPMWDLKTALRRHVRAERVIVLADAAHAGGTRRGLSNPINASFADLFTPSRRLTLTAGAAGEVGVGPSNADGHGLFTRYLLEALRGQADTNADGVITFREVADYVAARVQAETNGRQNPQRTGLGDIPLAVVRVTDSPD